jgi:hypothetical protein
MLGLHPLRTPDSVTRDRAVARHALALVTSLQRSLLGERGGAPTVTGVRVDANSPTHTSALIRPLGASQLEGVGSFKLALRPTIPAPEQSTPTREQRDEALALRRTGSTAGPVACGAGYAASGAAGGRATSRERGNRGAFAPRAKQQRLDAFRAHEGSFSYEWSAYPILLQWVSGLDANQRAEFTARSSRIGL